MKNDSQVEGWFEDGAIVFAGLPDSYESEGYGRTHLNMPESHTALIAADAKVNPHVIILQARRKMWSTGK